MTVWEIIIMMVMATVCVTCGIGIIYSSIVNTVERYQIRKSKRELEVFTKVISELPNLFGKMVETVEKKEQERSLKFAERMKKREFDLDE